MEAVTGLTRCKSISDATNVTLGAQLGILTDSRWAAERQSENLSDRIAEVQTDQSAAAARAAELEEMKRVRDALEPFVA
eukprot:7863388-Pyramimonas_sp.AAC.1